MRRGRPVRVLPRRRLGLARPLPLRAQVRYAFWTPRFAPLLSSLTMDSQHPLLLPACGRRTKRRGSSPSSLPSTPGPPASRRPSSCCGSLSFAS